MSCSLNSFIVFGIDFFIYFFLYSIISKIQYLTHKTLVCLTTHFRAFFKQIINKIFKHFEYSDYNVYCRELAPGTVSLTGNRAQGDDSKQCAFSNFAFYFVVFDFQKKYLRNAIRVSRSGPTFYRA